MSLVKWIEKRFCPRVQTEGTFGSETFVLGFRGMYPLNESWGKIRNVSKREAARVIRDKEAFVGCRGLAGTHVWDVYWYKGHAEVGCLTFSKETIDKISRWAGV